MLLELHHITKRFPGIVANRDISLGVAQGEIHAIVGENGAGKTTLMNILYGLYHQDEGDILWKGQPVRFHSSADAIACGIGMVHQHFMLIPSLTVTENVMLGATRSPLPAKASAWARLRHRAGHLVLRARQTAHEIAALAECVGFTIDPHAKVGNLSVGERQRVEIIKALYRQAELLILDEPTSVLTPGEIHDFFTMLKTLTRQGMSVIFITHKLQEVMEMSDRATVLRNGSVVSTVKTTGITQRELAQMMVGRSVLERLNKRPAAAGHEVLRVEDLSCVSNGNLPILDRVSFTIRAGEILGIAGVSGNGQAELAEILSGLRKASSGKITIHGRDVTHHSPRRRMNAGLSHIPEERQEMGIVLDFPLYDNAVLGSFFEPPFSRNALLNMRMAHTYTENLLVRYDVKAKDITVAIHELSGGNQQKFVVGRELDRTPRLLLAVQPTRGVDIGATEFIHQKLLEQRDQGVAILLISTELDEIFALSDRIGVMYNGRLVEILSADRADRETVGLLMAGISNADEHVA